MHCSINEPKLKTLETSEKLNYQRRVKEWEEEKDKNMLFYKELLARVYLDWPRRSSDQFRVNNLVENVNWPP